MNKSAMKFTLSVFVVELLWLAAGGYIFIAAARGAISGYWSRDLRDSFESGRSSHLYSYFYQEKFLVKISRVSGGKDLLEKPLVKGGRLPVNLFSADVGFRGDRLRLWYAPEFLFDYVSRRRNAAFAAVFVWLLFGFIAAHLLNKKALFSPLRNIAAPDGPPKKVSGVLSAVAGALDSARSQLVLYSMHSSVLLQAAKSISSHMDLNHAVSRILDIVVEKFPNTSCSVNMLDEDGYIRVKNTRGLSADFIKNVKLRRGEGFIGDCMESKKIVIVQDASAEKKFAIGDLLAEENIKSFVHLPIIVENRTVGTFNVNSSVKNYFTHEIMSVATTLCEYLSVAVSNAKLYDRLRDFNRRLETEVSYTTSELLKTNAKLVRKIRIFKSVTEIFGYFDSSDDPRVVLGDVSARMRDIVNADAVAFFLCLDSSRLRLIHRVAGLREPENVFSRDVFEMSEIPSGESALSSGRYVIDNAPAPQGKWPFLPPEIFVKTFALFPATVAGKVRGLVIMANKVGEGFDEEDAEFVALLAARLGLYFRCLHFCEYKSGGGYSSSKKSDIDKK